MDKGPNNERQRGADLEERTFQFAQRVRSLTRKLPTNPTNSEDVPQLIRSSGSVAANYLEANDSLGKKDFLMRLRIARKEAKEARLFLRLLDCQEPETNKERSSLAQEALEIKLILSAILQKSGA